MSLFLTDLDQWDEEYLQSSPAHQYEMVKEAIARPIPLDYAEEADFGMVAIEMWDLLVNANQIEECFLFAETLRLQQPDFFHQEFQYYATFFVQYHLFHGQMDALQDVLKYFYDQPDEAIEELLKILEYLQFYEVHEPLVELCQAVYQPVKNSPKLLRGTETYFTAVLIFDTFDQLDQRIQRGEAIDWDAVGADLEQYGFENTESIMAEIAYDLTAVLEVGIGEDPEFYQRLEQSSSSALRHLVMGFCRYMKRRYQISFKCSRLIWETIQPLLNRQYFSDSDDDYDGRENVLSSVDELNQYFAIDHKELDRYLYNLIMSLLSRRQAAGFALVWGIPYLYEFLRSRQVIDEEVFQGAIAESQNFKTSLREGLSKYLWQYDFVHRWPCPDSVPEDEFAAEAEQFAASIHQREPLSDQIVVRPNLDEAISQLADKIVPPSPQPTHPAEPGFETTALPTWKPPKPRKSPLQEVSDLDKKKTKSKKSSKKKSGKGFS